MCMVPVSYYMYYLSKTNHLLDAGVWVIDSSCENKHGVSEISLFLYFEVNGVLNLSVFTILEMERQSLYDASCCEVQMSSDTSCL